ncbi:hypothetical protein L6164_016695 [Bauhinia variegata]|uniref:Uncharacterized protein n=1 Tax=Bauhinia variegata TaxID=167791 RepID=A0ACB9NRU7_BAUVA|nr:hypothetical protein L6164_016695 [Bauhinia variegata]
MAHPATDLNDVIAQDMPQGQSHLPSWVLPVRQLEPRNAPSTRDLKDAWWVSKDVTETNSLLNVEDLGVVRDTQCGTSASTHSFDLEACLLGAGISEDRRTMSNLRKFIERSGYEVEELRRGKRKVGGSSTLPTTGAATPTSKKPRFIVAMSPQAPSSATEPTVLDDSFDASIADVMGPPLHVQAGSKEFTAEVFVSAFIDPPNGPGIEVHDSVAHESNTPLEVGKPNALPEMDRFPPLDPAALVTEFQNVRLDAMLSHLVAGLHCHFGIV